MTIELVTKYAKRIANGNARIAPGQPQELHDAVSINDAIAQGDLMIKVIDKLPPNYRRTQKFQQLVPGNTVGSRHAIKDLKTISGFWIPDNWSSDADHEGLDGPAFLCAEKTTVTHPTHGDVIIAAGHLIKTRYQRNLDVVTRQKQRARD